MQKDHCLTLGNNNLTQRENDKSGSSHTCFGTISPVPRILSLEGLTPAVTSPQRRPELHRWQKCHWFSLPDKPPTCYKTGSMVEQRIAYRPHHHNNGCYYSSNFSPSACTIYTIIILALGPAALRQVRIYQANHSCPWYNY